MRMQIYLTITDSLGNSETDFYSSTLSVGEIIDDFIREHVPEIKFYKVFNDGEQIVLEMRIEETCLQNGSSIDVVYTDITDKILREDEIVEIGDSQFSAYGFSLFRVLQYSVVMINSPHELVSRRLLPNFRIISGLPLSRNVCFLNFICKCQSKINETRLRFVNVDEIKQDFIRELVGTHNDIRVSYSDEYKSNLRIFGKSNEFLIHLIDYILKNGGIYHGEYSEYLNGDKHSISAVVKNIFFYLDYYRIENK